MLFVGKSPAGLHLQTLKRHHRISKIGAHMPVELTRIEREFTTVFVRVDMTAKIVKTRNGRQRRLRGLGSALGPCRTCGLGLE